MRRLLAAFALLPLLPMPASSAASGPAVVRVSGVAGYVARVALPAGAVMSNGGGDSEIGAPGAGWAGVVVRRVDTSPIPDRYYRVELYEPLLCPGRHCQPPPYFQPTAGSHDDGRGRVHLRPGTYAVTLLGQPGTRVAVAIHTHAGRGTVRLAARERARIAQKAFVPAADVAVHDFVSLPAARDGSGFQLGIVAAVVSPTGTWESDACFTRGGSMRFDATGGAAPCHDFDGTDYFSPGGGPVTNADGTYVAMPWGTLDGPAYRESRLGVGLDGSASGAYARIVGVGIVLLT